MSQLEFDFGGHTTPTFETWYAENSTEKRKYGEQQYTPSEAKEVYYKLVDNGFFAKGGYCER
jgi:hypothetical protein